MFYKVIQTGTQDVLFSICSVATKIVLASWRKLLVLHDETTARCLAVSQKGEIDNSPIRKGLVVTQNYTGRQQKCANYWYGSS